jgi:UDP-2,3-diacylglucosamine hydrolase
MRLQAAAHWRCVDFVSDLHLSPALPLTTAAFERYLQQGVDGQRPDALFLLGDVFEVWVGDDALHTELATDTDSRHLQHCAAAVQAAAQHSAVHWIAGNRDFLLGADACQHMSMSALPDPCALTLGTETVVLSHGDAGCVDDTDYQRFRAQVRHLDWRAAFLALPLGERWAQAHAMRERSQARQAQTDAVWADVDTAWSQAQLNSWQGSKLIHGHTHRPGSHPLAGGHERVVLSDWDLDHTPARAQVLRWQAGQWRRHPITP